MTVFFYVQVLRIYSRFIWTYGNKIRSNLAKWFTFCWHMICDLTTKIYHPLQFASINIGTYNLMLRFGLISFLFHRASISGEFLLNERGVTQRNLTEPCLFVFLFSFFGSSNNLKMCKLNILVHLK